MGEGTTGDVDYASADGVSTSTGNKIAIMRLWAKIHTLRVYAAHIQDYEDGQRQLRGLRRRVDAAQRRRTHDANNQWHWSPAPTGRDRNGQETWGVAHTVYLTALNRTRVTVWPTGRCELPQGTSAPYRVVLPGRVTELDWTEILPSADADAVVA